MPKKKIRKKIKKRFNKKNRIDSFAWIFVGIIIIILLIFFLFFYSGGPTLFQKMFPANVTTQDFQQPQFGTCSLAFNKRVACADEDITGTIVDGIFATCYVAYNFEETGWVFVGTAVTDADGRYTTTQSLGTIGNYLFAVYCIDPRGVACRTNDVELMIIGCDGEDSDGDGFTDEEEIDAGTDPFDPHDFPEEEEPVYTCGIPSDISCTGTCPLSHPYCLDIEIREFVWACMCVNAEQQVHLDWKPGGSNYYEHDETPEAPDIRIFVTSLKWNGAMGGLTGMDQKCSVTAYYANLGSNWVALASDSTTNANSRIPDGRYVRLDGVKIADNKLDLFDGSVDNKINIDQDLEVTEGLVWSGSFTDGIRDATNTCNNWGWVAATAKYGASGTTGPNWFEAGIRDCDGFAHIYCFEVVQ